MSTFNGSSDQYSYVLNNAFKICVQIKKDILYKGIPFGGRSSSTHVFSIFMIQVILAFSASQIIYLLLKPLKQPKPICNFLGGIILGPSILGRNKAIWDRIFPAREMALVNSASVIGVIYIYFIIAAKTDTVMTLKLAKSAWKISLTILVVPFTITLVLTSLLKNHLPGILPGPFIYFFSSVLSQSCFTATSHAIGDLNLLTSELGKLAIACSIFHELVRWFNLALAIVFSGKSKSLIMKSEICMASVLLFVMLIARPAVKLIARRTPEGRPVNQNFIMGILIATLVVAMVSEQVGSSYITGAVIMGLIIPAGPPLGTALVEKCEVIISNIFMPFFYIRIGQHVNVHTIKNWKQFAVLESILVTSYLSKVAASLLAFSIFRRSLKNSLLFGLILNFRGIPDFILISHWRGRQLVDDQSLAILLLSHLLVTAIATLIIKTCYKPEKRLEPTSSIESRMMKPLQGMPHDTELRILFCIHNEDNVHSLIPLFKACNPLEMSPICAYVVHLVELVSRMAPLLVPYNSRRISKTNATDRIMRSLTKYTKKSGIPVIVSPFQMIAPYEDMQESICRLARDKYIPLIIIPFHKSLQADQKTSLFQTLNINVQAYAPCTVGIFIDRGLPYHLNLIPFSYNVAVFFLGGPDDREALGFVSRMNPQPGLSITLFRIDFKGDHQVENEIERALDDLVIKEFQAKNVRDTSVVYHQVVTDDYMQVMETIRSAESKYDLVIVGKRRVARSLLEKEMKTWVENEELGIIGDMIASPDFNGGMTSILVIKSSAASGKESVTSYATSYTVTSSYSVSSSSTRDDSTGRHFDHPAEKDYVRLCTNV